MLKITWDPLAVTRPLARGTGFVAKGDKKWRKRAKIRDGV